MRTYTLLTGLVAACGLLAGCGSAGPSKAPGALVSHAVCQRNQAVGTINFVSPYAYDASAGIMDVFMADRLGYFKDLCLTVKINAASFTGEQLVSAGRAQVTGIGSAADAIVSAGGGANLTGVATYGATDPHVILTNEKITSLKQLDGKTVGYYTNINPGALQTLVNAGADIDTIKFVKLTSYDPTIVPRGQVDGEIGYASNQGTALAATGDPYHAFYPAQYGVKGTYNVMQLNTSWLHQHTAVAADFMRADLKATAYCVANQAACVKYITDQAAANNQGAGFPLKQQTAVWRVESKFIRDAPKPLGSETVAEWQPEYALVQKYAKQAGLAANDKIPPLAGLLDPSLVDGLYKGNQLIWPGD